jgi:hypothetical protein
MTTEAEILPLEATGTEPALLVTRPAVSSPSPTPMGLIELAMQQGSAIDLDRMERLMQMQERWDKEVARKAFLAAMAEFRANAPELRKDSKVDFTSSKGRTNYNYADLEEVSIPIGRVMGPLGLSFRWDVKTEGQKIIVTTILQHRDGHSEQLVMPPALPDDSGNKNSIQAVGSTVTYLERYGLLAITGMAVKGEDTDGRVPKAPDMPKDAYEDHLKAIAEAKDTKALSDAFNAAYSKTKDPDTKKALLAAKDRRFADLKKGASK